MNAIFSDDDTGKKVKNANGMAIGTVAMVDEDTAYVETDPGVADSIMAALGWETNPEDTVPLDESTVHEITDDAIHLKGDRSSQDSAGDAENDTIKRDESTGQRDVGPAATETGEAENEGSEEAEGESSAERHSGTEEAPADGDQIVTRERDHKEDQ